MNTNNNEFIVGEKVQGFYRNKLIITGIVYDESKTHVWIETVDDLYVCKIENVRKIKEVKKVVVLSKNEAIATPKIKATIKKEYQYFIDRDECTNEVESLERAFIITVKKTDSDIKDTMNFIQEYFENVYGYYCYADGMEDNEIMVQLDNEDSKSIPNQIKTFNRFYKQLKTLLK